MKIGIIGLGRAGKRHATHAYALGHEVLWSDPGADLDAPWQRCGSAEEVMDRVDAVVIASPTPSHAKYLHEAIVRGRPVLVEKPIGAISTSTLVADSLMAALSNRIPVATGFNLRFHPGTDALKRVQKPHYGHFICAQHTSNIADGVVNHWASHEIDLARYVFGNLRVFDHYVQDGLATDLYLINWDTNARVHLHADMLADARVRQAVVVARDNWAFIDYEANPVEEMHYKLMLHAFFDWVQTGFQPQRLATGWDGHAVLKLCEKASTTNVQRDKCA